MISVIRAEQQKRAEQLEGKDPNVADDQWLFTDEPFINEMCLLVMVGIRHDVERQLILLAGRANVGPKIDRTKYKLKVADIRKRVRSNGLKFLESEFQLNNYPEWNGSMRTLQLLANCLKHEPTLEPDPELLEHLGLPLEPSGWAVTGYMPLPESEDFRKGLAKSVDLPENSDFCSIAECFVREADSFLDALKSRTPRACIMVPLEFGA
jgi:hypothetical protein